MEVVREAIESLRSCFRPHDPHHHTLDTLEQVHIEISEANTGHTRCMLSPLKCTYCVQQLKQDNLYNYLLFCDFVCRVLLQSILQTSRQVPLILILTVLV